MNPLKKIIISLFIIFWLSLFHYESLRAFYLTPFFGHGLPKFPLLFPPAGWIMFYEVDDSWSTAEVFGLKEGSAKPEWIDPHRIFETRFVGFDNIHRNIMVNVLNVQQGPEFCKFLARKFPGYVSFTIFLAGYRSVLEKPNQKLYQPLYQCT